MAIPQASDGEAPSSTCHLKPSPRQNSSRHSNSREIQVSYCPNLNFDMCWNSKRSRYLLT